MGTQIRVSMRDVRTSFPKAVSQADYTGDLVAHLAATQATRRRISFVLFQ